MCLTDSCTIFYSRSGFFSQIIKVELTGASNGGSLGADRSVDIIVPANDNPYGTVYFQQSVYRVQEPLEGVYTANITVRRRYFEFMISPGRAVHFQVFAHCQFPIALCFIAAEVTLDACRSSTAHLTSTSSAWPRLTAKTCWRTTISQRQALRPPLP